MMLGWKKLAEASLASAQAEVEDMADAEAVRDATDDSSSDSEGSVGSIPLSAQTSDAAWPAFVLRECSSVAAAVPVRDSCRLLAHVCRFNVDSRIRKV